MENKYNNHPSKSVYHDKSITFLNISEKIRYVGIINKFGRTLSGASKECGNYLLSPEQAKRCTLYRLHEQQLRNFFRVIDWKNHILYYKK